MGQRWSMATVRKLKGGYLWRGSSCQRTPADMSHRKDNAMPKVTYWKHLATGMVYKYFNGSKPAVPGYIQVTYHDYITNITALIK